MADSYDTTIRVVQGSTETLVLYLTDLDTGAIQALTNVSSATITAKSSTDAAAAFATYTATISQTARTLTFSIAIAANATAGRYLWQFKYVDNSVTVIDENYHDFYVITAL